MLKCSRISKDILQNDMDKCIGKEYQKTGKVCVVVVYLWPVVFFTTEMWTSYLNGNERWWNSEQGVSIVHI